jgi:hypothetical protein
MARHAPVHLPPGSAPASRRDASLGRKMMKQKDFNRAVSIVNTVEPRKTFRRGDIPENPYEIGNIYI